MKKLKLFLPGSIAVLLLYLAASFANVDFNIANWNVEARVFISFVMFFLFLTITVAYYISGYED